jgi:hypothetical protein
MKHSRRRPFQIQWHVSEWRVCQTSHGFLGLVDFQKFHQCNCSRRWQNNLHIAISCTVLSCVACRKQQPLQQLQHTRPRVPNGENNAFNSGIVVVCGRFFTNRMRLLRTIAADPMELPRTSRLTPSCNQSVSQSVRCTYDHDNHSLSGSIAHTSCRICLVS